jgi:hypothetical protein
MTKLLWGSPGERYFETGVDRGVLFVDNVGYAWNGLASVTEKSSGGELQEYYQDGIKYAQILTAEDFVATIEAYSAPREFLLCNGMYEVYAGISATQQRRKEFGFSYRTRIGNDISGEDLGYKLHVVYNAIAQPSENTYESSGGDLTVNPSSWEIVTVPGTVANMRPTAHFVIDTRRAVPAKLTTLEDQLYGTNVTTPTLPTPSQLIAIFA